MPIECTVVVATYNRSAGLSDLLRSLEDQTLPPDEFEVVVVDDGSTDDTWRVATETKTPYRLRALRQANQGPAAARNAGILAAEGGIIVTLDDDLEPAPDLLARHLAAHAGGRQIAAFGVLTLAKGVELQPWVRWEERGLSEQYDAMKRGEWLPTWRQFFTANASVERQVIIDAGLFDPKFRRAEDVELAYRLAMNGVEFVFLSDAIVNHKPNRNYEGWENIARMYGHYDMVMWHEKGYDVMEFIQHEFKNQRHGVTRIAARLVTGRSWAVSIATRLGRLAAMATGRLRLESATLVIYSTIFNLLYYDAAARTLRSYGIDHKLLFTPPSGRSV